eukprot:1729745-Prymnesium_polylepis.1
MDIHGYPLSMDIHGLSMDIQYPNMDIHIRGYPWIYPWISMDNPWISTDIQSYSVPTAAEE